MNKKFTIALIVLIIGVLVLSSCAQNRGTGYATGSVPPPRVTGGGGGCGVGAPAGNGNDAADNVANAAKTTSNNNLF